MKYRLTLEVIKDNLDKTEGCETHWSDVELSFPMDAYFSTHTLVQNALRELIPLLVGEALKKFENIEVEE